MNGYKKNAAVLSLGAILFLSILVFSPLALFAQSSVSIVSGSSSKTTDAYSPNPAEVSVGGTVIWTNNDSTPHTATSGQPGVADGMFGGEAGGFGTILTPGNAQEFTFTKAGEFPYYCGLHPNMVGTVMVSANGQMPANATGIELADAPLYSEHVAVTGQNQINATYLQVSWAGNGTITLPNSTAIKVNSTGSAFINLETASLVGHETITTEGGENGTAHFYQIIRRNPDSGLERGVVIAIFHTNSAGQLAPLDGMIGVGQSATQPDGDTDLTLFEWQSDIPPAGSMTSP